MRVGVCGIGTDEFENRAVVLGLEAMAFVEAISDVLLALPCQLSRLGSQATSVRARSRRWFQLDQAGDVGCLGSTGAYGLTLCLVSLPIRILTPSAVQGVLARAAFSEQLREVLLRPAACGAARYVQDRCRHEAGRHSVDWINANGRQGF